MLKLNIKKPIDRSWSVEKISKEWVPTTWEQVFADAEPELHDISDVLENQEKINGQFYPDKKDIFAAFHYTPLKNVKVVIVGQDPYHQTITVDDKSVSRAVGLSFSVRQEDSIPSSLNNIYTELQNSVLNFTRPDHGDLREWTNRGVLLLNMSLTVQPNKAGSHGDIWLGFINKVFKQLAITNPQCIFLLWGKEAQKLKQMIGDRSVVFEAAHPSGYSAHRGFFGCNHFNLVNEALAKQGKKPINWHLSNKDELNSEKIKTTTSIRPGLVPVRTDLMPMMLNNKHYLSLKN
jgi:uracil-DNA glycosylase